MTFSLASPRTMHNILPCPSQWIRMANPIEFIQLAMFRQLRRKHLWPVTLPRCQWIIDAVIWRAVNALIGRIYCRQIPNRMHFQLLSHWRIFHEKIHCLSVCKVVQIRCNNVDLCPFHPIKVRFLFFFCLLNIKMQ